MPTFPTVAKLLRQGYAEQPESGVSRTPMDDGMAVQLKTKTRVLVRRPVRYAIDSKADYATFNAWFHTTINKGADWFDWVDPLDGATKAARIANGRIDAVPVNSALTRWTLSFQIETWSA